MTVVTIDIRNGAGVSHVDDRVVVWAPKIRRSVSGGVVSTAPQVVKLVDGVASVNLEPGAVCVKFECRGIADTSEKFGVVPTAGPVDILSVLNDF